MRVILISVVFAALGSQPVPDPFIAQHDAAAARNALSPRFTIAIGGNRRTFSVGEPIPLVVTYNNVSNRRFLKDRMLRYFATPVLDHADGTSDPYANVDPELLSMLVGGDCGCSEGGSPDEPGHYTVDGNLNMIYVPPPPRPKPPAVVLTVWLTSSVQFNKPGHYRLYLEDHFEFFYSHPEAPPIISNVIEIDITSGVPPRDR